MSHHSLPTPIPGTISEEEVEKSLESEIKKDQIEIVPSVYDKATALTNLRQLWPPAQGLQKTKPVTIPEQKWEVNYEPLSPAKVLLTSECLWRRETQFPLRV